MDQAFVERTEQFLKDTFSNSVYLQAHPTDWEYRIQHSYRVANLAKYIAQQEGLDVTDAVIAGLLHDIAYCEEMPTQEAQRNHRHRSVGAAAGILHFLLPAAARPAPQQHPDSLTAHRPGKIRCFFPPVTV